MQMLAYRTTAWFIKAINTLSRSVTVGPFNLILDHDENILVYLILGLNVCFQTWSGVWKLDGIASICMGSPMGLSYENDVKFTLAK